MAVIRNVLLLAAFLAMAAATKKPNIVYIMTDDQDVELGGMRPMPRARKLLGEAGAVGQHFYIQEKRRKMMPWVAFLLGSYALDFGLAGLYIQH